MSSITLRESTVQDEIFVNRLTRVAMESYVRQTWEKEADVEAYFLRNQFDLLTTKIIQYNGKDVGRISVTRDARQVSVDNIHILPAYQGKGIGKYIMQQILKEADAQNLPTVLYLLQTNPAKSLYESLGFQVYETKDFRYYMRRLSN
jgi:ribosomal protein S18 acetylase RimI-like enzyme